MSYTLDKHARCAVIGYGSWATALIKILLENEKDVVWHIRNNEVADHIKEHRNNYKYLSSTKLDVTKLIITDDINHAVDSADIIILAVPSAFLELTLEGLTVSLKDKIIYSAIKGIIPKGFLTIAEYINQQYNVPFAQLGVLTGPCHAEEVALERLTYINIVSCDEQVGEIMSKKLKCSYINTNIIADIYGAEYSAVMKNIYAIAVGMATGIGYGDNFIAVLIANAAREINIFLELSYKDKRELNSSAYIGDLLVTCYSKFSRNRSFGLMVGKGYSVATAQREMEMVAEGYWAASCIYMICKQKNIELPIAESIYQILYNRCSARAEFKRLSNKLI